jgi:ribosome-binding protein aMBF1 (putative translation factor)
MIQLAYSLFGEKAWMVTINKKKKNPILIEFAAKVRNRRHALTLTQEQLAERADFHVNYIGGIERAERNPSITSLLALAKALKCHGKDLLPEK